MKTYVKPSRVRTPGPREKAFLRGEPVGDFEPAPFYQNTMIGSHVVYFGTPYIVLDELPFTPEPQPSVGSVLTPQHSSPEPSDPLSGIVLGAALGLLCWGMIVAGVWEVVR